MDITTMPETKRKILIVEDEASLARALETKLIQAGYTTRIVKNGKEGLAEIKRDKPDLVLLDIIMPVMDGMTMLEELKKDKTIPEVPVMLLTNLSDSESIAEAMDGGGYDYLVKSDWSLEDVVKKVKEKLGS